MHIHRIACVFLTQIHTSHSHMSSGAEASCRLSPHGHKTATEEVAPPSKSPWGRRVHAVASGSCRGSPACPAPSWPRRVLTHLCTAVPRVSACAHVTARLGQAKCPSCFTSSGGAALPPVHVFLAPEPTSLPPVQASPSALPPPQSQAWPQGVRSVCPSRESPEGGQAAGSNGARSLASVPALGLLGEGRLLSCSRAGSPATRAQDHRGSGTGEAAGTGGAPQAC